MNEEGCRGRPGPGDAGRTTSSIDTSQWIGRDGAQSEARNLKQGRQLVASEPGVRGAVLYGGEEGQEVPISELLRLWVGGQAGHHEVV